MIDLKKAGQRGDLQAQIATIIPGAQLVLFLVRWITAVVALPFEVFMRFNFGERYLSAGNVLLAGVPFSFMAWAAGLRYLLPLYWLFAIGHLLYIRNRNRRGDALHSLYDGRSWLSEVASSITGREVPEQHIKMFVEPAIGLLAVWALIAIKNATAPAAPTYPGLAGGGGLLGSGIPGVLVIPVLSSILQAGARAAEQRNQLLDLQDSILQSQYTAAALRGISPTKTAGVQVAPQNTQLLTNLANNPVARPALPLEVRAAVSELTVIEKAMLDAEEPEAETGETEDAPVTGEGWTSETMRPGGPARTRAEARVGDPFDMLDGNS